MEKKPLIGLDRMWIILIFFLGIWAVVLKQLDPSFSFLPRDLIDSRFNNYLLEHFYRFVLGIEKSFWSASFWYPYPNTISFSDNFIGSGFFYIIFS
jgi:hypothetical protein